MKRKLLTVMTGAALALAPTLHADDVSTEEGTPVGKASDEGAKNARKKTWQNVAIAAVIIAGAVIALILVADNDGHHSSH